MKLKGIVLFLLLGTVSAIAQEETLINGNIESGGFGGPVVKIGSFNGTTGIVVGGRGGWIINHTYVIGGGGYGLANDIKAKTPGPNGQRYLSFGYGGLELEYIAGSDRLLHYSVMSLVGVGGVSWRDNNPNFRTDADSQSDTFFIVEPGLNVTLNVTSYFRISGGVSYRFVSGTQSAATSDADLSGLTGVLTFHFGKF